MYYETTYNSPVGAIKLASDAHSLVGLWIEGQKYYGGTILESMTEQNNLSVFDATKKWLDEYFEGRKPSVSKLLVPLAPIGSEFRRKVWDILCEIPYGRVTTYGEIAKKMAKKSMSARAVGGAVGHNPISIIIPCHRVIGANNSLTGYAGGIDKKIRLLELEGVDTSSLAV